MLDKNSRRAGSDSEGPDWKIFPGEEKTGNNSNGFHRFHKFPECRTPPPAQVHMAESTEYSGHIARRNCIC